MWISMQSAIHQRPQQYLWASSFKYPIEQILQFSRNMFYLLSLAHERQKSTEMELEGLGFHKGI